MGWLTDISPELSPAIGLTTVTWAVAWRSGQVAKATG
jgi:hypothetical protein